MQKYVDITGDGPPPYDLGWYSVETGEFLGYYSSGDEDDVDIDIYPDEN